MGVLIKRTEQNDIRKELRNEKRSQRKREKIIALRNVAKTDLQREVLEGDAHIDEISRRTRPGHPFEIE